MRSNSRSARRALGAAAVAGLVGAMALPAAAGAASTTTQKLTGTIASTISLTQTAPGTNLTTLTPGSTSTATSPTLDVSADTTYSLTVSPAWGTTSLSHPLKLAMTVTQGAGDTNTAPQAKTVTLTWGATTSKTLGAGTAQKNSGGGTVEPDAYTGTFTQPVSYGDAPGTYSVTLTYTAAAPA